MTSNNWRHELSRDWCKRWVLKHKTYHLSQYSSFVSLIPNYEQMQLYCVHACIKLYNNVDPYSLCQYIKKSRCLNKKKFRKSVLYSILVESIEYVFHYYNIISELNINYYLLNCKVCRPTVFSSKVLPYKPCFKHIEHCITGSWNLTSRKE